MRDWRNGCRMITNLDIDLKQVAELRICSQDSNQCPVHEGSLVVNHDGVANHRAGIELGFANSAGGVLVPLTEAQTLEFDLL